ncbi:MAG: efflux RND transporter permease subunit [bacterium]
MNLPKFAVHRPVLTTMVFIGILVLGLVSFTRLQIDLLPEIDFPSISVVTTYEGAGPEEIETIITRPMEQALSTIEGIDRIESFSTEGRSRVALRFVWGTNLDTALNDVRATVERLKERLPEEADDPVVYKFNLGSFPVMYLGLSGSLDEPTLRLIAERDLGPRLERLEGVAAVEARGGLKREIHILLDGDRLRALGISPRTVIAAVRENNRNIPAGQVDEFDEQVLVRSVGEAANIQDFQDMVVAIRSEWDGKQYPIYLKDIAEVLDTFEEPTNVVYVNGQPGIRLNINKQSGSNTVAVADTVRKEIENINKDYNGKLRLDILTDTSEYIKSSISNVQESVLIGALLAVFVLLFFLRSVRSTVIIATGIPISIIGMFTLMYYFDITLNLISFGGVALGIGMLVDNAIVILENIFKKYEDGLDPKTAAIEGSQEVAGAIVASTLTTVVVFVPVIFLTGFAAIFFGQMAFVVSFALICSLAVALTLIPVLSSKFLKRSDNNVKVDSAGNGASERVYGAVVDKALQWPKVTLSIAVVLLGGSLAFAPLIGTELMPEGDQSEVVVNVELPVGTRIELTERAVKKLERIVAQEVPEIANMQTIVGTPGFWSTSGGESARIEIKLVKPHERSRSSDDIANALMPKVSGIIPGADIRTRAGGGLWILRVLRGGGERLEVQVRGFDLEEADRIAGEVKKVMEGVDGISSARASRQPGGREVQILPDRSKIAGMGLTYNDVASQLQTYLQGTRASVLRDQGDEFNVVVQLREDERRGIEAVLEVPIVVPGQGTTPLRNLVTVNEVEGPLTIERLNQNRVVTVNAQLTGERDLGTIVEDLRVQMRDIKHSSNFAIIVTGESEEQNKTFASLLMGILLAIALVYMVMAAQFESFHQPFMIMFSVPFAAIGVVLTLVATGTTFNIQSFMGCVVLTGIVVNNAIVLIDYINLMRSRGMALTDAVALSARRRLRPILMTTATTMLALIPVAIGYAEGGEAQAPLARVVVGGLLTSTAISLIIIPVLYQIVEGWIERRGLKTTA